MQPTLSILDDSFRYVPAMATSVSDTWIRFGWCPPALSARSRALSPATGRMSGSPHTELGVAYASSSPQGTGFPHVTNPDR